MKILYNNITKGAFLFLLSLFALSACSNSRNEEPDVHSTVKEGERFTTRVAINSEALHGESLRANSIENISEVKSLRVLVFDENQNYLYSEDVKTLKDVTSIGADEDHIFLPDHKQDGITEIRYFEVSLVKSSKKRYVHFVANHDWTGFTQDYYAKGTSAGEFMTHPSLVDNLSELKGTDGKTANDLALWSVCEVPQLDEDTFKGKVVKLLRTYAKVTLKVDDSKVNPSGGAERFELTGYSLCNVPDRGTIAPFATSIYSYDFPFPPVFATLPADLDFKNKEEDMALNPSPLSFIDVSNHREETPPYYLFEKDNTLPDHKTFVIIRGRRYNSNANPQINGEVRYYKIDLVTRKQVDPNDPNNKGINTYFHILRNKYYTVNINGIKSDGYKTVKEAIESVAGNNVFADTKLREFGNVSDGALTLSVEPIQMVIVRPGTYSFKVGYSGGTEHVKYYPSWNVNQDLSHSGYTETGYYYIKGEDSFMGGLRITMGSDGKPNGFEIDVRDIPTDATKEYTVEVAALRKHNGTTIDAISGATAPLSRSVRIVLNSPYPFNEKLAGASGSAERTLTFRVYEEKIFPKAVFPFDVYIKAPGMTPVNAPGDVRKLTIENVYNKDTGKYETFYKYTVQERDRGTVSIPFKVNNLDAGTGEIQLTSQFYQPALIQNDKVIIMKNLLALKNNEPRGSYSYALAVDDNTSVKFKLNGGPEFTVEQLQEMYGIVFKPNYTTYSKGDFVFDVPDRFIREHGNDNLTIFTQKVHSPTEGSVRYSFQKTMTVNEWTVRKVETGTPITVSTILDFTRVEMTGRVYYQKKSDYYSYGFSSVKDKPMSPYRFISSRAYELDIDLTADFKISDVVEYEGSYDPKYYYEFKLDISDPEKLKAFTARGMFQLKYLSLTYGDSQYTYLTGSSGLESKPVFEINVGDYE